MRILEGMLEGCSGLSGGRKKSCIPLMDAPLLLVLGV